MSVKPTVPCVGAVKFDGVDAFEFALRVSLTPYGVPSGCDPDRLGIPLAIPRRIVCPMAVRAPNTASAGAPSRSIDAVSGSH